MVVVCARVVLNCYIVFVTYVVAVIDSFADGFVANIVDTMIDIAAAVVWCLPFTFFRCNHKAL